MLCKKKRAFTLIELLVVVAIIALLVAVLLPAIIKAHERANQGVCATHLRGIYQALNTYAQGNRGLYPMGPAGASDTVVRAFNDRPQRDTTAQLSATARTASLSWNIFLLVRDMTAQPSQFVCPSVPDGQTDPLTVFDDVMRVYVTTQPVDLNQAHDFGFPRSFTYSPHNFFSLGIDNRWSTTARGDFVLMGDDNNADDDSIMAEGFMPAGRLHTTTAATAIATPGTLPPNVFENSRNHDGEGQNLLTAGGAVAFANDPYKGPGGDNVYARNDQPVFNQPEIAAPIAGQRNQGPLFGRLHAESDSMLVPVRGNNGGDIGAGASTGPFNLQSTWQQFK